MNDPEPGDEGRALRLAVQVGEGLRRGGWWALGAASGALVAQLAADLVSLVVARGAWDPSLAAHAVGLAGAATVGLAVGSPGLHDPREASPVGVTLGALVAPWIAVVVVTVVEHNLAGPTSLRGLEAAIALLRDPNAVPIDRFLLLCAWAWALAVARWAHAGGDLTGPWLRRLPVRPGAIGPAVVAGAVLPWVIAVAIGGGVVLAVGSVTLPAGALLAERRLRPWLRARLARDDDGPGAGPSPPVSSGP